MKESSTTKSWDEEVEVMIIGSGFAGLAAAIEAKLAGASPVIIEKMKGYGGNSFISDGMIAAAGTPVQAKAGIEDSPGRMMKDMLTAGLNLNYPELVEIVASQSAALFQWTMEFLGVKYREKPMQLGGHSAARSYTTHNHSGSAIIKPLLEKVRALDIEIRTCTYLETLIRDASGRVSGVRVRSGYRSPNADSGTSRRIKANKGVIVASGGFAADIAFRAMQDPRLSARVDMTTKHATTGEVLREALRIGAAPVHLSHIQLGPWTSPDEKLYGSGAAFTSYVVFPFGLMVHPETGNRLVNELADRKIRADAILNTGAPCIGIVDAQGVVRSEYSAARVVKKGVAKKFDSLKDLCAFYNLPAGAIEKTVTRYNRWAENGIDEEFGKPLPANATPLVHPPYYGIRIWPKVHYTMGGVKINRKTQVIDLWDNPIEGLYAAGEVTGGIHGACRLGSCSITECLVFGRIAGKSAAR